MSRLIGEPAPNFTAETTQGPIDFYEWVGESWCVLFSHPKDFTAVCTTELGEMARLQPEFRLRACKIIGHSVDTLEDHVAWIRDIKDVTGAQPNFPLISDVDLTVAKLYGMLPMQTVGGAESRTAADNATVRSVFIIDPDKRIKLVLTYPMSTGRNFHEILRALDSLQLTARHKVATPANWRRGDAVLILPTLSDQEAEKAFPEGWAAPKPYVRIVPHPPLTDSSVRRR